MAENKSSLAGKTAIVTGAAHGICRAITARFAEAGARVVCSDIDGEGAETAAAAVREAGGDAQAFAADVTRLADMQALAAHAMEAYGRLDVVLYGAASQDRSGTVVEIEEEEWQRAVDINFTGAFRMCKAAIPHMQGQGGSIILIASQLARVVIPNRAVYVATKGGLLQLAKALAADHASDNIRVNTLSPGVIETERVADRFGGIEAARETLAARHLLNRLGRPEEMAEAALFLASEASSFMTGADLLVDGGYTAT